jgi:hypothetical protein
MRLSFPRFLLVIWSRDSPMTEVQVPIAKHYLSLDPRTGPRFVRGKRAVQGILLVTSDGVRSDPRRRSLGETLTASLYFDFWDFCPVPHCV